MSQFILQTLAPFCAMLFSMSCTATLLGGCILLLRCLFDRIIPPYWKSALWWLVLIALLVPYRIPSPIATLPLTSVTQWLEQEVSSVAQFSASAQSAPQDTTQETTPALPTTSTANQTTASPNITATEGGSDISGYTAIPFAQSIRALSIPQLFYLLILPCTWLLGAFFFLLYLRCSQYYLYQRLRTTWQVCDPQTQAIFTQAKATLHITQKISLVQQDYIETPAIIGLFHPTILLPHDAPSLPTQTLRFVLLHELSHYKRKDVWLHTLLLLLQGIYWFNPCIWFLFRFIRQDIELCNDNTVLRTLGHSAQKQYAASLLSLLGRYNHIAFSPTPLCMANGKDNMKRRIQTMQANKYFRKHRIAITMGCLVTIGILAAAFLTEPMPKDSDTTSDAQASSANSVASHSTASDNTSTDPNSNASTSDASSASSTADGNTSSNVPVPALVSFADGLDDDTYTVFDSYTINSDNNLDASFCISDATGNEIQTITYSTHFNQSWYNMYLENDGKMVRFLDVNFDGHLDFVGQMFGAVVDQSYQVWLYQESTGQFVYSEEYSAQTNPVYNPQSKRLLSTSYYEQGLPFYTLFQIEGGHLAYLGSVQGALTDDGSVEYIERMYGERAEDGSITYREVQTMDAVTSPEDCSLLWDGFPLILE